MHVVHRYHPCREVALERIDDRAAQRLRPPGRSDDADLGSARKARGRLGGRCRDPPSRPPRRPGCARGGPSGPCVHPARPASPFRRHPSPARRRTRTGLAASTRETSTGPLPSTSSTSATRPVGEEGARGRAARFQEPRGPPGAPVPATPGMEAFPSTAAAPSSTGNRDRMSLPVLVLWMTTTPSGPEASTMPSSTAKGPIGRRHVPASCCSSRPGHGPHRDLAEVCSRRPPRGVTAAPRGTPSTGRISPHPCRRAAVRRGPDCRERRGTAVHAPPRPREGCERVEHDRVAGAAADERGGDFQLWHARAPSASFTPPVCHARNDAAPARGHRRNRFRTAPEPGPGDPPAMIAPGFAERRSRWERDSKAFASSSWGGGFAASSTGKALRGSWRRGGQGRAAAGRPASLPRPRSGLRVGGRRSVSPPERQQAQRRPRPNAGFGSARRSRTSSRGRTSRSAKATPRTSRTPGPGASATLGSSSCPSPRSGSPVRAAAGRETS